MAHVGGGGPESYMGLSLILLEKKDSHIHRTNHEDIIFLMQETVCCYEK